MSEKRRNWSREETILAMELYCRTPFSKISKSNSDIVYLAEKLNRTPSAVAKKMFNLAHYDPTLKARNVSSLAHTSKLDQVVFFEFYQNMHELYDQARTIKESLEIERCHDELNIDVEKIPEGGYKEYEMKNRVGQYYFRSYVLASYGNKCCVTGLSLPQLLIASHIKPWSVSDDKTEKTNPSNGLCLNRFHDIVFDKGLMTLDKSYRIIISSKFEQAGMDDDTRRWFMNYKGAQINLPDKFIPLQKFIEYHNDMIFIP